jgi:hypothetical protein
VLFYEPPETVSLKGFQLKSAALRSDRDQRRWRVFAGVPEAFGDLLTTRGDLFLPLVMILSLVRKERVDLSAIKVDPVFLRNVFAAIKFMQTWRPKLAALKPANIVIDNRPRKKMQRAAALYSGGVDSLFSLVRHSQGRSKDAGAAIDRDLDYALHVYHGPEPVALDEIERNSADVKRGAERLNVAFIPIFTNMMTFDQDLCDVWGALGHGAGLASVIHLLGGGVGCGLIASSHTYGKLVFPWGSSPVLDPLYSSSDVQIVHDGSTYTRVEKTDAIAQSSDALASINVCDNLVADVGYVNCSACQKCLRTMVTLDLLGKAGPKACSSFDWSRYRPENFGEVFLRSDSEATFAQEIVEASDGVRPDIKAAAERALRRSRMLSPLAKFENTVKRSRFARHRRRALQQMQHGLYQTIGVRH